MPIGLPAPTTRPATPKTKRSCKGAETGYASVFAPKPRELQSTKYPQKTETNTALRSEHLVSFFIPFRMFPEFTSLDFISARRTPIAAPSFLAPALAPLTPSLICFSFKH